MIKKDNYWLIFFRCKMCGLIYKIYIKDNILRITILGKLHSYNQLFDSNGYLLCIECKHKNKLQIQKVYHH